MNIFFRFGVTLIFSLALSVSIAADYEIFKAEGKVGLKDSSGTILIPAIYDELGWSNQQKKPVNGVIGYRQEAKWGLISLENKIVTDNLYSKLYPANNLLLIAARRGKISGYDFLGSINTEGKIVLPFQYSSIDIKSSRAIVSHKSGVTIQYGLIDMGAKELIEIKYKEIKKVSHWYAVKGPSDKFCLYDQFGGTLTGFDFDDASFLAPGYVLVKKDNAYGLFGKEGKLLLPATTKAIRSKNEAIEVLSFNEWIELNEKHEAGRHYHNDLILPMGKNYLVRSNGSEWLMDRNKNALTPTHLSQLLPAENGFMLFRSTGRWGLLDKSYNTIVPPKYDSIQLNQGLMFLQNAYKLWSVYDTLGIKKTNYFYEVIGKKTGYLWPVKRNGYWGFMEQSGAEVIRAVYDTVNRFVHDKVVVGFHGESGIIDKQGEWVVYPEKAMMQLINDDLYLLKKGKLTILKSLSEGTVYFTENDVEIRGNYLLEKLGDGKLWKIDFNGRITHERPHNERFEEVREPSEGLYPVKINGLYGFVDERNRLRISNRYENVGNFKEGLAPFRLNKRWGFIDLYENIKVQPLYDHVTPFVNGLSIVRSAKGFNMIDKNGKKLSTQDFDQLERLQNGRFIVRRGGFYGLTDPTGRLLVNVKYEHLNDLNNGFLIIKKFDQYGLITEEGVDKIPAIYDQLIYDREKKVYLGMKKSRWVKATL